MGKKINYPGEIVYYNFNEIYIGYTFVFQSELSNAYVTETGFTYYFYMRNFYFKIEKAVHFFT